MGGRKEAQFSSLRREGLREGPVSPFICGLRETAAAMQASGGGAGWQRAEMASRAQNTACQSGSGSAEGEDVHLRAPEGRGVSGRGRAV